MCFALAGTDHCEALEPTCQHDARAPRSVCGALAETCLRGAMSEQSSSSRPAGCSHAEPPGDSAQNLMIFFAGVSRVAARRACRVSPHGVSPQGVSRNSSWDVSSMSRATFALFVVAQSVNNPWKKALSRVLADTDGNVLDHAIFPRDEK